jgi:hypothetical protein
LRSVISGQFKPWRENWLIEGTPGVAFLKREVEELPFVRTYVLPTALRVGPHHALSFDHTTRVWSVAEDPPVDAVSDTDDEFVRLYHLSSKCQ